MLKPIKRTVMFIIALIILVLMLPIIGLTYLFSLICGKEFDVIIEPTNYSYLGGIINISVGCDREKPDKNDDDDNNKEEDDF